MRKILSSHNEVAHFWANKIQEEGRASNVFFQGDTIYSYGTHFPIAKHVQNDTILFTNKSYSYTTAKHINIVRRAIPANLTVINCDIWGSYESNVREFKEEIDSLLKLQARAKSRNYTRSITFKIENARKYLVYMNTLTVKDNARDFVLYLSKIENDLANNDFSQVREVIKAETLAKRLKRIERQAKEAEAVEAWKLGNYYTRMDFQDTYCRISKCGGLVETTQGAKVTVKEAKTLCNLIKHGKDIKGMRLSGYTVIGYTNNILTVGCHKIKKAEVERITAILETM